jgi:hypothetical protein
VVLSVAEVSVVGSSSPLKRHTDFKKKGMAGIASWAIRSVLADNTSLEGC